ncbi:MAG: cell division protein FtsZ [Alphaproteobacteria bacterium]|nr:cell division protein FtsZ [Alphaproteobacteria bacterium]
MKSTDKTIESNDENINVVNHSNENELGPKIIVIGVGGAGGNAVNNMIRSNLEGVKFFVANTDAQALQQSLVEPSQRIQLGLSVTQGLGAGSKPEVGRAAAEESSEEILNDIKGANMVFIAAGMGGGTGTGAAPVIAKIAKETGILTIGVVTKPFSFEGPNRTKIAEEGIRELQQYVDTLIVIPNQNLFRLANESTTLADAFKMADNVLYSGVRGITDLMIMPGLINLDFADIRAVMSEMGKAMMGTGEAEGERRALDAAEAAISNPLLDDVSLKGAKGILINIMGGYDMTLYEVDEAANKIREEVDKDANIIFGSIFDERLNGTIRVSVVATGIGPQTEELFNRNKDIMQFNIENNNGMDANSIKNNNMLKDVMNNIQPNKIRIPEMQDNISASDSSKQNYKSSIAVDNEEKGQRKPRSFFDRFGAKQRLEKINNELSPDTVYNDNNKSKSVSEKKNSEEELEIPACFRRKR